jgi:hypothetical protein
MLPLLILIVPPSIAGGSYVMWYSGQQVVLRRKQLAEAPPQSAASYTTGIMTLVGTYGLQSFAFPDAQTKITQGGYVPPQSIGEVFQRVGRPIVLRLGASSAAFFCAGVVQTYVTTRRD